MSLPYPEPGVRLIRQDRIDDFAAKMREFQDELTEAVETLDRHYNELKATARQRLGSLFNTGDYPESLRGMFSVEFDFPSVDPQRRSYWEEVVRRWREGGQSVRAFCVSIWRNTSCAVG